MGVVSECCCKELYYRYPHNNYYFPPLHLYILYSSFFGSIIPISLFIFKKCFFVLVIIIKTVSIIIFLTLSAHAQRGLHYFIALTNCACAHHVSRILYNAVAIYPLSVLVWPARLCMRAHMQLV